MWVVLFFTFTLATFEKADMFAGPLIANFSYIKKIVPIITPWDCTVSNALPIVQITVFQDPADYDTIHVTGTPFFNGWNDTSILQWFDIDNTSIYPSAGVCYNNNTGGWILYVGTGTTMK